MIKILGLVNTIFERVLRNSIHIKRNENGSVYTELAFIAILAGIISVPLVNTISPLLSNLDRDTDIRLAFQGIMNYQAQVDYFDHSGDLRDRPGDYFNVGGSYETLNNMARSLKNQSVSGEDFCVVAAVVNEHFCNEPPRIIGHSGSTDSTGGLGASGVGFSGATNICEEGWTDTDIPEVLNSMAAGGGCTKKNLIATFPIRDRTLFSKFLVTDPGWN